MTGESNPTKDIRILRMAALRKDKTMAEDLQNITRSKDTCEFFSDYGQKPEVM